MQWSSCDRILKRGFKLGTNDTTAIVKILLHDVARKRQIERHISDAWIISLTSIIQIARNQDF